MSFKYIIFSWFKKRVAELTKQQKEAAGHLKGAETSLGKTSSMLSLLQKSKEVSYMFMYM